MKLSFTPIAAAVAVAIASTSAHAALSTTLGTAAPGLDGLYVSIWDTSSHNSELVNLGNNYAAVTAAGALTPNTATSPYVLAANPAGAGNVYQVDFGVLPSFSTTFATPGATTDYMVLAANATSGAVVTNASTAQMQQITNSAVTTLTTGITGQISNWSSSSQSASGTAIDTSGSANYNALIGPNNGGNLGLSGYNFSGAVGSALNFYNIVKSGRSAVTLTQYANTNGNGFWFLSGSGDLTWNVPASSVSTVPLPAAVWLFASSLAGLGAIGRRRLAAAA